MHTEREFYGRLHRTTESTEMKRNRRSGRRQIRSPDNKRFPVAMRFGETPVPIPNTTVKTEAADDTMLETAWESRWLPDSKRAYSSAG